MSDDDRPRSPGPACVVSLDSRAAVLEPRHPAVRLPGRGDPGRAARHRARRLLQRVDGQLRRGAGRGPRHRPHPGRRPRRRVGPLRAGPDLGAPTARGAGPAGHRHRLRRGHDARRHPVHPSRSRADRRAVPRHDRPCGGRRDRRRDVHRHPRALGARGGAGRRRRAGRRPRGGRPDDQPCQRRDDPPAAPARRHHGRRTAGGGCRVVAGQPLAAALDARSRAGRAEPDVRVLRRGAARGPGRPVAARPGRPVAAGQRRGPASAVAARRRGRPPGRRAGAPARARDGPRGRHGARRRDLPDRRPGRRGQPGRRPLGRAGPGHRGHVARPHRAARAGQRAQDDPRVRRGALRAGPRVGEPAADRDLPDRAGPGRRGAPVRRDRAGRRAAPHGHRRRGGRGARAGGAGARQGRGGERARRRAAGGRRPGGAGRRWPTRATS